MGLGQGGKGMNVSKPTMQQKKQAEIIKLHSKRNFSCKSTYKVEVPTQKFLSPFSWETIWLILLGFVCQQNDGSVLWIAFLDLSRGGNELDSPSICMM